MNDPIKPKRNYWGRVTWRGAKPGCVAARRGISLPLNLKPDDLSPEAARARLSLNIALAQINPRGWRSPRLTVRTNSGLKVGRRHLRSIIRPTRLDALGALAKLAGKAGLLTRIKQMAKA